MSAAIAFLSVIGLSAVDSNGELGSKVVRLQTAEEGACGDNSNVSDRPH